MPAPSEFIIVERQEGLLHLRLNRAEKKNAISGDMYRGLTEQLILAADDADIHVVLLSAAGDCFCAGSDIREFELIRNIPYSQRPGFRFMNCLSAFNKPLVAAVNGNAVGIGATMLLHCDLVYASEDSSLTMPFVDIGLVPEFASTLLLPRMLGHPRAAEILMLGKAVSAAKCLEFGLFNKILSASEVLAYAKKICRELADKPLHALVASKRLMKQNLQASVSNTIETETIELSQCLHLLAEKN